MQLPAFAAMSTVFYKKACLAYRSSSAQLFRFCTQSTLPHLLATDVLRAFSARPPDSPLSPFTFSSPFIAHLQATTTSLASLSHHSNHGILTASLLPILDHCTSPCFHGWPRSYGLLHSRILFLSGSFIPLHQNSSPWGYLALLFYTSPPPATPLQYFCFMEPTLHIHPPLSSCMCLALSLLSTLPPLHLSPTSPLSDIHTFLLKYPLRTLQ